MTTTNERSTYSTSTLAGRRRYVMTMASTLPQPPSASSWARAQDTAATANAPPGALSFVFPKGLYTITMPPPSSTAYLTHRAVLFIPTGKPLQWLQDPRSPSAVTARRPRNGHSIDAQSTSTQAQACLASPNFSFSALHFRATHCRDVRHRPTRVYCPTHSSISPRTIIGLFECPRPTKSLTYRRNGSFHPEPGGAEG